MSEPQVTSHSANNRINLLTKLQQDTFDCIIIGGGITGAGLANAAASSGLKVALVEADDFASGTSSKSTKLIHGGLRYLAMGDFALVKESALERKELYRIAPHLAEPHWMVLPARNRAEFLKFRVGVNLYEKLGAVEAKDRHQNWGAEKLCAELPMIDRRNTPFACAYREYLTDDARLVLANIRKAALYGTISCNYLRVTQFLKENNKISGVEARCSLSGDTIAIKSRCVINASGPWAEELCYMDQNSHQQKLQLSKGVHVVVPAEKLPVKHPIMLVTPDGRPLFAIPHGAATYLGTTDTVFNKAANYWPHIEVSDVDYILRNSNANFPEYQLCVDDCMSAWSGLRPLISNNKKMNTKKISRKDEVWVSSSGLITIAGGKLTGYRKMAEHVLATLKSKHNFLLANKPVDETLPGGNFPGNVNALAESYVKEHGVSNELTSRLVRLYGTESKSILNANKDQFADDFPLLKSEIAWGVYNESAQRLTDMIYRRTRCAIYYPKETKHYLTAIGQYMATLVKWTPQQTEKEIADAKRQLVADILFT